MTSQTDQNKSLSTKPPDLHQKTNVINKVCDELKGDLYLVLYLNVKSKVMINYIAFIKLLYLD